MGYLRNSCGLRISAKFKIIIFGTRWDIERIGNRFFIKIWIYLDILWNICHIFLYFIFPEKILKIYIQSHCFRTFLSLWPLEWDAQDNFWHNLSYPIKNKKLKCCPCIRRMGVSHKRLSCFFLFLKVCLYSCKIFDCYEK